MAHPLTDIKPISKATGSNSPTDTTPTSLDGSTRATSLEYDTPGTTPAHSVVATSGKRKRTVKEEEAADEKLARQLQEEEYTVVETKTYKRSKLAYQVEDTEDDSELSELESIDSMDYTGPSQKGKSRQSLSAASRRQASVGAQRPSSSKKRVKVEDSASDADSDVPLILRKPPRHLAQQTKQGKAVTSGVLTDPESEYDFGTETVLSGVSDTDSTASELLPTISRSRTKNRETGRRRRRFGNLTASNAADMADEIGNIVERSLMSRKDRERKKLEKSHPGIKTMWEDLQKIPVIEPVAAAQPTSINRTLKSFQLQGLDWMTRQEKTHYGGGLLGDEMGMGKTIQAVSLIMSDYPQKQPTLVVVPPVALMQWSSEITDYTDGKLKVLVYHGQNSKVKVMTTNDIKKFDVVMISYNSLESLYRKETKGWSRGEDIVK